LDFQKAEADKYRQNGMNVRTEVFEGETYVVPFSARRQQNISPAKLALYVSGQAEVKYNRIIDMHRELTKRGYDVGNADFSTAAMSKYTHYLEQIYEREARQAEKVKAFAGKAKGRKSKQFGITAEEIAVQVGKLAATLWEKGKKAPKTVAASAVLGAAVLGFQFLPQKCADERDNIEVVPVEVNDNSGVYTDFMGKQHSDTFGNIARIMELKPEISAMLIAVEGYADNAYKDGVGVWTIGSGTTFYLDDDGRRQDVKAGDRTTPGKAMSDKWRFIEKEMIKYLGDDIGRKCSDEELMCCIGAGFCWGGNAFSNSEFYNSVKRNESVHKQARKLTGFRKQKGLLKREYLLSACLLGKWTAKDLLDMPIYKIAGKGYLNSAIYRLELSEIMPCKRDKKGNFERDKDGNHIPVVAKDGFCTFYDNTDEIKKKMFAKAKRSFTSVKYVREFMPKEMVQQINQGKNDKVSVAFIQKNSGRQSSF